MSDHPEPAPEPTPGPVGEDARLRDCGQGGVCAISPGCLRHWEERSRELVAEVAALKVALDEAAELLIGMAASGSRQTGKTAVSEWLTRYAVTKGPALEPRAARGQKG